MGWNIFQWRSLKTRVTLTTLAIFVIGIWSLAYYVSRMLREDMQHLLSEQQFSTVSYIAADINEQLDDRFRALEVVAGSVGPATLGNTATLQGLLEQHQILQSLFNAGTFATRIDGTTTASIPLAQERTGVNYMDRAGIAATLKEGKVTIGRPVIGKKLLAPVFNMAVPIRDAQGKVIGALVGVTNLGMPNFMDKITEGHYGKTGGYLLIAPQYRLVVTATDKSRIMEALPAPGINPLIDRFIQGYEGSAVIVNPLGEEMLASDKSIPLAGWIISAILPTAEAFAPIRSMQQRLLLISITLTLLACALTWWMLRYQLSPMVSAARALATLSHSSQFQEPLPITRQDEIGDLIGGFNGLLETLRKREADLVESEAHLRTIIENEPECIKIVDSSGRLIQMNKAGLAMIEADSLEQVAGRQVLDLIAPEYREAYAQMHERVLTGESIEMEFEVLGLKGGRRWLQTHAVAMQDNGDTVQLAITRDITDRKQEELGRIQAERDLREALRQVEQKERSKSRFLAATSHDLRQPLYAAQLFVDSLASILLDSHQLASANKAQQALKAISSQLRLLLDLSRLEDTDVQISKQEKSTIEIFEGLSDIYGMIAKQANVRLLFHPGELILHTDHNMLSRLLGNLIDNAIKFSPGGTVLVCVRRTKNGHKIQVRDNGQGIADIHHEAVFDDFYQIGNRERNPAAGYGLGLSIVSRIARLLGIQVRVASAVGKGSIFSVVMPNLDSCPSSADAASQFVWIKAEAEGCNRAAAG